MKTKQYKKRNLHKTLKKYKLYKKSGIKKGGEVYNDDEYITDDQIINFCDFIPKISEIKNKNDDIDNSIKKLFDKNNKFILYKKIRHYIPIRYIKNINLNVIDKYKHKYVYELLIDNEITEDNHLFTEKEILWVNIASELKKLINDDNKKNFIDFLIKNKKKFVDINGNNVLDSYPIEAEDKIFKNDFIKLLKKKNPQLNIDDTKTHSNDKQNYIEQDENWNKIPKNVTKKQLIKNLIKRPMKELKKVTSLFRTKTKKNLPNDKN